MIREWTTDRIFRKVSHFLSFFPILPLRKRYPSRRETEISFPRTFPDIPGHFAGPGAAAPGPAGSCALGYHFTVLLPEQGRGQVSVSLP